jgi:hypothetical protein
MSNITQPSLILPKFLLEDDHLSTYAKLLLALLDDYRNKVTGQCNPRIKRLADNLKVCERTIYRALAELRKWRLIAVDRCQHTCQYIIAARDQWRLLLRKTFSTAVENPNPPRPPEAAPELTNCQVRPDTDVRSGPPVSLLTEPTQRTYLSGNEGDAVPRSVHHAAAAAPSSSEENFRGQRLSLRSPFTLELCETLLKVHPQPGLPVKALLRLDAILGDGSDTAARCAKTIEIRHAQWIEYWNTLEAGKFIPQLWRWLEDRDWTVAPVIRKPALRAYATAGERNAASMGRLAEKDRLRGRQ